MSPTNNNKPPDDHTVPQDTASQLAHELANLLDGSLRHLGIAINTLSGNPSPAETQPDDKLLGRLHTTDRAMRQMASLIHAWMKAAPQPRDLFEQSQTLKQTLDQIIEIHQPSAARHNIDLSLQVDTNAAKLPAGPVFPVVANAILNSIQAIADADHNDASAQHSIEVIARLEAGTVWIMVNDDGPGLNPDMIDDQGNLRIGHTTKPDGHGIGLTLSQQVAQSLNGKLELRPRPEGGTSLVLRFPASSLQNTPPKTVSDTVLLNQPHEPTKKVPDTFTTTND